MLNNLKKYFVSWFLLLKLKNKNIYENFSYMQHFNNKIVIHFIQFYKFSTTYFILYENGVTETGMPVR